MNPVFVRVVAEYVLLLVLAAQNVCLALDNIFRMGLISQESGGIK